MLDVLELNGESNCPLAVVAAMNIWSCELCERVTEGLNGRDTGSFDLV